MGTCPNCGAYISPGTNVCSCGTTFGYIKEKEEENSTYEPPKEYTRLSKKARSYMAKGEYLSAVECYNELIEKYPRTSISVKAEACFKAGLYEEALECYKSKIFPSEPIDNIKTYQDIGKTLECLNRFDEAMKYYEKALKTVKTDYRRHAEIFKNDDYHTYSQEYIDETLKKSDEYNSIVFKSMAWSYYLRGNYFAESSDKHYRTAIEYIEEAIRLSPKASYYNIKAIILEAMKCYDEALKCYDSAIKIEYHPVYAENKSRMLHDWSIELCRRLKSEKSLELICNAIDILTNMETDEDINHYIKVKEKITERVVFKKEYSLLRHIGKENLITIAGTGFYSHREFRKHTEFVLKNEPENRFDPNAIAVYMDGEKIGYVANSPDTVCDLTVSADYIYVLNFKKARYIMHFKDKFHIAEIIKATPMPNAKIKFN